MQTENATPETKAPETIPGPNAELKDQLLASIEALEGVAARQQDEDRVKLEAFRKKVDPQLERAAKLVAEFKGFQGEFGPYLDRLTELDMARLRTFTGYNLLGDIAEDAKTLKTNIDVAIQRLGTLSPRVNALRPDTLPMFNLLEVGETIDFFRSGPELARDKVKTFVARMKRFELERTR